MSKPSVLQIDNLDDRRELYHMLHRLPPQFRLYFVEYCCCHVGPVKPTVNGFAMREVLRESRHCDNANETLTMLAYTDMMTLGHQWGLDFAWATLELEKWVKRPGDRKVPRRVKKGESAVSKQFKLIFGK